MRDSPVDPRTADLDVYLVGGAVRDRLLGLPVRERDFVVVGATAEELLRRGFRLVGKDFPVFLHPDSHEEYALARTERKVAPGYRGFAVHADPQVTLEQDLRRRDLTINALAEDRQGRLIDPFGGLGDLGSRTLRHISPAFREDPVRVLRLARFAARFADLGFAVAAETRQLVREMGASGELAALVPERVWQELARALATPRPSHFFTTLRDGGALARLFPEIDRLWGVPQPALSHPEIDTALHTMLVVDRAAELSTAPEVRLAALLHDLGKGLTPPGQWPRHPGHERRGMALARGLCERLRMPRRFTDLVALVARFHGLVHRAAELRPATLLQLLEAVDAWRRPQRFEHWLLACEADFRGRPGYEKHPYVPAELLHGAWSAARLADREPLPTDLGTAEHIGRFVRERRLRAIVSLGAYPVGDRAGRRRRSPQRLPIG
jgi:tRNA nucleotidyltransferase (CCA-adding enzyme)